MNIVGFEPTTTLRISTGALTELSYMFYLLSEGVVIPGLEPGASSVSGMRSNQLSYMTMLYFDLETLLILKWMSQQKSGQTYFVLLALSQACSVSRHGGTRTHVFNNQLQFSILSGWAGTCLYFCAPGRIRTCGGVINSPD